MQNNYKININTAGDINIINRNGLTIQGIRGKKVVENLKHMLRAFQLLNKAK
jgi:hypothetical protein